jgi:23S rRNA (cytosine1962-C5)-methyltransferase
LKDIVQSSNEKSLQTALERRAPLLARLAREKTNVFRLIWGDAEGIPGIAVDVYAEFAVLQEFEGRFKGGETELKAIASSLLPLANLRGVYLKRFVSDRSQMKADPLLNDRTPYAGEAAPEEYEVNESGLRYLVRLYDGFSTGLFADQRDSRRELTRIANSNSVLNTFSYTCAFSVACAAAGAKSVMSVDISKKVLEWGVRNAELNHLSLDTFRYRVDDTMTFLRKAVKRGDVWNLVIVDPPSFARSDRGVFSFENDHAELVQLAESVVAPGGFLYLASNFAKWSQGELTDRTLRALKSSGRWKTEDIAGLPADFDHEGFTVNRLLMKAKP